MLGPKLNTFPLPTNLNLSFWDLRLKKSYVQVLCQTLITCATRASRSTSRASRFRLSAMSSRFVFDSSATRSRCRARAPAPAAPPPSTTAGGRMAAPTSVPPPAVRVGVAAAQKPLVDDQLSFTVEHCHALFRGVIDKGDVGLLALDEQPLRAR